LESLAKIQALLQKRDFYEAGEACERAIRASGESLELLYLLGYALSSQFRFKEATRALRKAVAVKPVVDVTYALAEALYKTGELDEATTNLNRLLAFNASDARFIELRGKIAGRAESGVGCRLEMVDLLGGETLEIDGDSGFSPPVSNPGWESERKAIYSAKGEQRYIESICCADDFPFDKVLVDIGAGDGMTFSNSLNLLDKHRWKGLLIEPAHRSVAAANMLIAKQKLNVSTAATYANPETVCNLLAAFGIPRNFGFLSLDVDSIEYPLLQSILCGFRPGLICVEINERVPPPIFFYTKYSRGAQIPHAPLFLGASIQALVELLMGFDYCCTLLEYNNLFAIPCEFVPLSRRTTEVPDQSAARSASLLYEEGYRSRPDRLSIYPWNRRFEDLLDLEPGAFTVRWHATLSEMQLHSATVCRDLP